MPAAEKKITLDSSCKPLKKHVAIGVPARDIRWTRADGGAVGLVTVNDPDGFFGQGYQDGSDYVIPYNGAQRPPMRSWTYVTSCPPDPSGEGLATVKVQDPPQMTNGGG